MSSYQPSKHVMTFNIAGFQHHDGATVLRDLRAGAPLVLDSERDNPYDPNAMAIRYEGVMLGYVPKADNELLSTMFYYGHADAFEARVLQVDERAKPWEQVLVGVYITDAR